MKAKAITYQGVKKSSRIAATILMAAGAAVCLYAVIFMHRHDHLLTTVGYAIGIWAINHREEGGANSSR